MYFRLVPPLGTRYPHNTIRGRATQQIRGTSVPCWKRTGTVYTQTRASTHAQIHNTTHMGEKTNQATEKPEEQAPVRYHERALQLSCGSSSLRWRADSTTTTSSRGLLRKREFCIGQEACFRGEVKVLLVAQSLFRAHHPQVRPNGSTSAGDCDTRIQAPGSRRGLGGSSAVSRSSQRPRSLLASEQWTSPRPPQSFHLQNPGPRKRNHRNSPSWG